MSLENTKFDPSAVSSNTSPALTAFELIGQQNELFRTLNKRSFQLAQIYLGALKVLDSDNPDALALSAHGFRELMEKLPRSFDVPMPAHEEAMEGKINSIEKSWEEKALKSSSCENGRWSGKIDSLLAGFLKELRVFFEWKLTHRPRRKEEIRKALKKLDLSGKSQPEVLENLNIDKWREIREFFVRVAHHRGERPHEGEFVGFQYALEKFILDLLDPRVFEDMKVLDQILREANDG